jgi:chemosensory pili system protein ChpA (sensor histidine kinase/response regulator)
MNDPYDNNGPGDMTNELGQRIDSVRELIGLLAVSPTATQLDDALPTTPETFQQLSERLRRLLEQAGMADCARATSALEQPSANLPSEESFQAIDAVLAYVRARVRDVTLLGHATASHAVPSPSTGPSTGLSTTVAPESSGASMESDTSEAHPSPAEDGAALDDNGVKQDGEEPAVVADAGAGSRTEDTAFDESQYSMETQAVIRTFKSAPLRQRAPGEIARALRQPARERRDVIPETLRRECLSEAAGDLADLRALIASFGKMPGSLDDLRDMSLLAHKSKGTVSTYLYYVLADILHCLEDVPRVLQPVAVSRAAACMSLLIRFADLIEVALQEAGDQGDASQTRVLEAESLLAEARELAASQDSPGAALAEGVRVPLTAEAISEPITMQLSSVHRAVDEELLRVEPRQLDSLMHQSDSLAMNRASLTQSSDEIYHAQLDIDQVLARLAGLSAQLTDLHPFIRQTGDATQVGSSGPRWLIRQETSGGTWDDQELDSFTLFDEKLRALSEAVLDATTLSNALYGLIQRLTRNSDAQRSVLNAMQQTIIHMRLVSLKTLADRVLLAAHQAAETVGRQVQVSIVGQNTEIDRNISEALIAPIVQLVRNAIAHGIESPGERLALGKSAAGRVWLQASYSGNEVNIEVGDDGRGVNPHQLIAAAVSATILDAKHADFLTRDQALKLMFEPNLSTSDQADVIAGHGIGLDSVLTDIQRLRGSVSVRSEQRQGTVFQIRVPFSLSITRALHVRVADHEYAIPFATIRQMFKVPEAGILVSLPDAEPNTIAARFPRRVRVARQSPERPLRLPDDPMAALYDEAPVFSLAELLGMEEAPRETHMALLVDAGQRQVAVLVDEVLDESEVVIRALPAHLRRRAVRGASIASDGRLFLVLDLADLLADALGGKSSPHPQPTPAPEPARERVPQVLVVDDSISMRRALEGALTGVGYDVRVARDGVEALGAMIADLPDIMVLDLEMPRLDGFELLSVIRGNEALARVPVVILTSRAAEKHHRQAMELGVRAYLTKPCPDEVLITTLQRVLREWQQEL